MAADEATPARLAEAVVASQLKLRRNENLLIETWSHTLPFAAAMVVEARRLGARPLLIVEDESAYWRSLDLAPTVARWSGVGHHEWAALAKSHGYVFFPGPADRVRFRSLPAATRAKLVGYNAEWYRRAKAARVRGVRCVLGYATDVQAAHWGVPAGPWRAALIRGTVEADYRQIEGDARRVAHRLQTGTTLRITGSNGSDLSVRLRRRTPRIDDGVISRDDLAHGHNLTNSPPGVVGVAVDERSASGLVVANRPSFLPAGRVEGGQWEVKDGRLVNAWYTDGQATFDTGYQAAPKNRDVLGFVSVGLNPALAPGTAQVEDQEAGAVTLGIGENASYGGTNRSPFVSWVVLGEATVAVDGKPVVDRGKIL